MKKKKTHTKRAAKAKPTEKVRKQQVGGKLKGYRMIEALTPKEVLGSCILKDHKMMPHWEPAANRGQRRKEEMCS